VEIKSCPDELVVRALLLKPFTPLLPKNVTPGTAVWLSVRTRIWYEVELPGGMAAAVPQLAVIEPCLSPLLVHIRWGERIVKVQS
jgi:hypothetical protein